jgi:hypothetical protein
MAVLWNNTLPIQELDDSRVYWMIRRFKNPQCVALTPEALTSTLDGLCGRRGAEAEGDMNRAVDLFTVPRANRYSF